MIELSYPTWPVRFRRTARASSPSEALASPKLPLKSTPLRVLALLEANSISGTAKPVLEMAREAKLDRNSGRPVHLSVGCFLRGHDATSNALTAALKCSQVPFSFIHEKHRFDPAVISQIRNLLQRQRADVVWTNSVKSHFLVYQANVQKDCAWVAFHHGYTSTDFKMLVYNQFDRFSLRHADRVLTVCRPLADEMRARGVPSSRIRVQHMAIRPFSTSHREASQLHSEFDLPADAKVILNIGRLSHEKAQTDLITAFAELRNRTRDNTLRLIFVGEGPERTRLEQRVADLGLRNDVLFAGHRDDARRFYGIATVFALSSYAEGTPNVLLESMAAGVPVVSTSVGGVPELVTHGQSALLVKPGLPSEMANALQTVLHSPALRDNLTLGAREVVQSHPPSAFFRNLRRVFFEAAAN